MLIMRNGIPTKLEVTSTLSSEIYKIQKKYNDLFLLQNSSVLQNYMKKWVVNPLWQWSRIYEYPFVEFNINQYIKEKNEIKILDAGSGITFFPFKLTQKHEIGKVICLDYDESLGKTYSKILNNKVSFVYGSLDKLDFPDNSFDIIYCISVLEHTDNYLQILTEFKRVIKNGGLLIITFDIGLSNNHKLNIINSNKLLSLINEMFPSEKIRSSIDNKTRDVWSTKKANQLDENLLPYAKTSLLMKIKNKILFRNNFPNLTFYVLDSTIRKLNN